MVNSWVCLTIKAPEILVIIFRTKIISFLNIANFRIQPHHFMGVSLEWLNHLRITEMKRLQSGAETITRTMREKL